jgi:hypothetical protein
MPFTGFWNRWRRRQLQDGAAPSLRETEKQREAAARQAADLGDAATPPAQRTRTDISRHVRLRLPKVMTTSPSASPSAAYGAATSTVTPRPRSRAAAAERRARRRAE